MIITIYVLFALNIERAVMSLVYKIIFYALDPTRDVTQDSKVEEALSLARQIEHRIVWLLVDFLTASAMLYLFYCVGMKSKMN